MPFTKTGTDTYKSPSGRTFNKKQVKMYYATNGFTKKKVAIVKKSKKGSRVQGETFFDKKNRATKVEINVGHKKHKDKAELASTIKHELLHVKHPKMTEKEVYSKSAKTKISPSEQTKLIAKLRMKGINQKTGGIKRKFKMGRGDTSPGDLITKINDIKSNNQSISTKRLAILGLV